MGSTQLQMLHDCSPVNLLLSQNTHTSAHTHYIQTHACISTWRQIRVYRFGHPELPQGTQSQGRWSGGDGHRWMDGWTVSEKTGWQDGKTELRTRSSTMWQLGQLTGDRGSREADRRRQKKQRGRKPEGQEVKHLCFLSSMASITRSVMGGETVRIRDCGGRVDQAATRSTRHLNYKIKLHLTLLKVRARLIPMAAEAQAVSTTLTSCHLLKSQWQTC